MISPETIEKIMDATRIEEVVGEFVTLKRRGVSLIGLCPFHNEKTPSFNVSAPKGIYKCFGCGKGGNAINFLMEHEHYSYPEALRYLAQKYGIDIVEEKPTPEQQEALDEKESLFNLTAFAQKYFEEQLHNSEEGKSIGLTYLKERGFSLEVIKKFGIGYCPNKWDSFSQTALKNGYKKDYLLKTSLSKAKDQLLYDTFRGRVIFPIHNLSGRTLGFGARILTNEKNRPKYINSAESEIYHKSKILYGIYFAKSPMASSDNCYLVEGYTDVTSLYQANITNVIATSGTALSTDQIKLIRRYTTNVTLLFDSDPAGIKAAFRGIDIILEEGLNVRVVLFPDGEDPDSYATKKRPAEVKEFLESQARDFISFKTEMLLKETQNDPIRKAALIRDIAQSISLIPEPVPRALYTQKCSDLMGVEEKLLVEEVNKLRRKKILKKNQDTKASDDANILLPQETTPGIKSEQTETNDKQEKELIRLLLHYADSDMEFDIENEDKQKETIRVKVADFILRDILSDKLSFENPHCQTIFDVFARSGEDSELPNLKKFTEHPEKAVQQLAVDMLSTPYTLSKNWKERHKIYVIEEEENLKPVVLQAVYAFKLKKLEKMIKETQEAIRDADDTENTDNEDLLKLMETYRDLGVKRQQFAAALNRIVTK
jgi:DNA primase